MRIKGVKICLVHNKHFKSVYLKMFSSLGYFLEVIHFILGYIHITGQKGVNSLASCQCLLTEATLPACGEQVVVTYLGLTWIVAR